MRTADRLTLDNILLHKEYFDQKLIEISNRLEKQVSFLTITNSKLQCSNQKYKKAAVGFRLKIKDLESQKITINKKYLEAKKEEDDIVEYLKKIQKEIDELKKENNQQKKEIKQQEKEIKEQATLIDKLKFSNSTNSNLPSSFDILGRTKARAQANTRIQTDRARGGQKNHPLHKSRLEQKAEHIISLKVKEAPKGAIPVYNEEGIIKYYITQEVDLLLKSVITETRYFIEKIAEELNKDILSKYAINPLTYSGNFKASIIYLNQKGTVPLQRLCDMMEEISKGSIQLRPSTICKWCEECHKKSAQINEEVLQDILREPLVYVDETGMKVNGKQHWIHTLSNEKGSVYLMTKSRGDKNNGPFRYLELYTGILMHDHFSTYQQLRLCQHAECNAHIDRYLISGIDFDHNEDCKKLLELMHEMIKAKEKLVEEDKNKMSSQMIKDFEDKYIKIIKEGLEKYDTENPNIKKRYEPDFVKAFRRMLVLKEDHLRFIKDFRVPYTNNQAERQCRVVKAKKKISGQFVSEHAGAAYVNILSLLQTAKIKNENALETLEHVFH